MRINKFLYWISTVLYLKQLLLCVRCWFSFVGKKHFASSAVFSLLQVSLPWNSEEYSVKRIRCFLAHLFYKLRIRYTMQRILFDIFFWNHHSVYNLVSLWILIFLHWALLLKEIIQPSYVTFNIYNKYMYLLHLFLFIHSLRDYIFFKLTNVACE